MRDLKVSELGIEPLELNPPIGPKTPVLDHGYLQAIEAWGSDARIVESARMSTSKGFLGWGGDVPCEKCDGKGEYVTERKMFFNLVTKCDACESTGRVLKGVGDEKLLRFLYMSEPQHGTPFEMAGLTIEVQAPIFVFREWHRHRVPFGYNEMSARYTPLPDLNYVPTVERLMANAAGSNHQANRVAGAKALDVRDAEAYIEQLKEHYASDQALYENALSLGVPKELARAHLPVGRYSRMRATGNLRGWLGFITLRSHPAAQFEIRQFSDEVARVVAALYPRTWALFEERREPPLVVLKVNSEMTDAKRKEILDLIEAMQPKPPKGAA